MRRRENSEVINARKLENDFDYARLSLTGIESSIVKTEVPAINFEGVATQFERIHDEDLIMQIANFFKICDAFKTNKA